MASLRSIAARARALGARATAIPLPAVLRGRAARRLGRSVFPGERRVWVSALVVLVALLAVFVHELFKPRAYFTSTDSIGLVSLSVAVEPQQRMCVPDVE